MLEKNNYKVSVLVANYNNQDYLSECLDSILNQSYKNIEIIVIDDNSCDESFEILERYKSKILIQKKKKNKTKIGSFDQMKSYYECLKISSGEIIFLCDSDDYFDQKKVEIIVDKFKENKNYFMVYDLPIFKFKDKLKYIKKKRTILKNYWSYYPPTSCISIKREQFLEYFKLIDIMDFPDIWLDFRLGILSQYIFKDLNFVEKNLTYYRQSEKNISSNFKFLSKNWWSRRSQAHDYVMLFFEKNRINYRKNLDLLITKIMNKIFL